MNLNPFIKVLIEVNAPDDATHYRQYHGNARIFWIKTQMFAQGRRWYEYNTIDNRWNCLLLSRNELPTGLKEIKA